MHMFMYICVCVCIIRVCLFDENVYNKKKKTSQDYTQKINTWNANNIYYIELCFIMLRGISSLRLSKTFLYQN